MKQYSYFIAAPMSSIPKEDYESLKMILRAVADNLVAVSGKPVYCAPLVAESANFDTPYEAYIMDIAALRQSEKLLMIYPPNVVNSGVLFEAGYAAGIGIPIIALISDRDNLPFMLREADKLGEGVFTIINYRTLSNIQRTISQLFI